MGFPGLRVYQRSVEIRTRSGLHKAKKPFVELENHMVVLFIPKSWDPFWSFLSPNISFRPGLKPKPKKITCQGFGPTASGEAPSSSLPNEAKPNERHSRSISVQKSMAAAQNLQDGPQRFQKLQQKPPREAPWLPL